MPDDVRIIEVARRIQRAMRHLKQTSPFFSILLSHICPSVDDNCETAYTDGRRIAFSPAFTDALNDTEMQFILCHEVMHVALRHLSRPGAQFKNQFIWNLATDIVVNSNIAASFGESFITLRKYGVSMHLAPDGKEGCLYSAEEVYDMLMKNVKIYQIDIASAGSGINDNGMFGASAGSGEDKLHPGYGKSFDNHDHWQDRAEEADSEDKIWLERVIEAVKIVKGMQELGSAGNGIPPCLERMVNELEGAESDWRTLLNNFIQEEVCDYSFNPPDRRFSDGFILPDFNDKSEKVKNVLFMVDTSGSVSDEMLTKAYSEIKGAIDQFDGRLEGYLGFFDRRVVPAVPFSSLENLLDIKPAGGGGTSFDAIFKYINDEFTDEYDEPSTVIILTDGFAHFPPESAANGIPVLWLINNEEVSPPWGNVARTAVF